MGWGMNGLKLDVAMAIGCADTPFAAHLLPAANTVRLPAIGCADTPFAAHLLPAANTVRLPAIGCADTPDIIILYCKRGISDDVVIQL
ncbi:MAG: hypothetical protein IIY06_03510 [Proteobacteria bacterium]|nr:hypothetical protein [Pseudomonadota bacterium]